MFSSSRRPTDAHHSARTLRTRLAILGRPAGVIVLAACIAGVAAGCTASAPTPAAPASSTAAASDSATTLETPDASATRPSPGATLPPIELPDSPDRLTSFSVLVVAADDALSARGTASVKAFVEQNGGAFSASVSSAGDDATFGANLLDAVSTAPDVIVTVGPTAVDLIDNASANNLGQLFLLVGAQLPEPTSNVTAAIWAGADSRGTVAMQPTSLDAFAAHINAGVAAGFAAILADESGYVFSISPAN